MNLIMFAVSVLSGLFFAFCFESRAIVYSKGDLSGIGMDIFWLMS